MINLYLPIAGQKATTANEYITCVKNETAAEMARLFVIRGRTMAGVDGVVTG